MNKQKWKFFSASSSNSTSETRWLFTQKYFGGGAHPKKPKKPVATPKSVNWHWFFLVFLNFQVGIGFFWFFFGFFLVFFWFFLALVLARIRNLKLVFFGFFWFFLVFFGIGLGQHLKLETGFLGSVGFFWFFLVFFLVFF